MSGVGLEVVKSYTIPALPGMALQLSLETGSRGYNCWSSSLPANTRDRPTSIHLLPTTLETCNKTKNINTKVAACIVDQSRRLICTEEFITFFSI